MNHAIYTALSGAIANDKRFDIVSNNLANANTTGFKKSRVSFASMLPVQDEETKKINENRDVPDNFKKGVFNTFTYVNKVKTDFSQGYLKETGNDFDFAINGDGFFVVKDGKGNVKYTRDGNFVVNNNGTLVDRDGDQVLDTNNNPIKIPTENVKFVNVDEKGNIYVNDNLVAKMAVVDFQDKSKLSRIGDNKFINTDKNIQPKESKNYSVYQGYLEGSNINIVKEMTALIEIMRSYEATQKVITTIDTQIDQRAVNDVGRIV